MKSEAIPIAQVQVQPPEPIEKSPQVPKPGSFTSSKGKKPSKKDLKQVAYNFMQQFIEASDDEEDEEEGSTVESSIHLSQIDPFQDAQDPYDGYDF
jgi:CRISPR/Cas system CSM-associated protein Csm4 (group 5 of RAMP superfamily)